MTKEWIAGCIAPGVCAKCVSWRCCDVEGRRCCVNTRQMGKLLSTIQRRRQPHHQNMKSVTSQRQRQNPPSTPSPLTSHMAAFFPDL